MPAILTLSRDNPLLPKPLLLRLRAWLKHRHYRPERHYMRG